MSTNDSLDYYRVLNVAHSATPEEIKSAYRLAARRYHPDTGGILSSEKKFSVLNEAYRVLSDPDLRHSYDSKLSRKRDSKSFNSRSSRRSSSNTDSKNRKERTASSRAAQPREYAGDNSGHSSESSQSRSSKSTSSSSSRTKTQDGSKIGSLSLRSRIKTNWSKIKTKFQLRNEPQSIDEEDSPNANLGVDHLVQIDVLESIVGTIKAIDISDESDTRGLNRITIKFRIPAGVSNGDVLKISKSNSKKLSKTLRVRIKITPHAYFSRTNKDIVVKVPITFQESVKGTVVEIPTLDGPTKVTVPPALNVDRPRLRLRNKGIYLPGGGRGHIIIEPVIVAPPSLNKDQTHALETLEKAYAKNVRAEFPRYFNSKQNR